MIPEAHQTCWSHRIPMGYGEGCLPGNPVFWKAPVSVSRRTICSRSYWASQPIPLAST